MNDLTPYNIRNFSFDAFVDFLFAHEADQILTDDGATTERWYWNADVDYGPRRVTSFYIRLFRDPRFLHDRFTHAQLELGFWAIISPTLDCSVAGIIWEPNVPFEQRKECVESMFYLFERFFADEPLDTSSFMWWDCLAYDWHCGIRSRAKGGEDLEMQEVIFSTLARILRIPKRHCQVAALHGLGHLHHPETDALVTEFLAANPAADDELRDYALAAARFEVP